MHSGIRLINENVFVNQFYQEQINEFSIFYWDSKFNSMTFNVSKYVLY